MDYRDSTSTHSTHVFFRLSASCSASVFDGSIDDEFYNPYKDRLFRGEARPTESIRIRQVSGRAPGDFVWTAMGPFIHNRIVELWKTNNVSGWSTYPVEIYDRKGRPVPGYHGLSVLGRCQSIFLDKEHSALIFEENQYGKFPYYEGEDAR